MSVKRKLKVTYFAFVVVTMASTLQESLTRPYTTPIDPHKQQDRNKCVHDPMEAMLTSKICDISTDIEK